MSALSFSEAVFQKYRADQARDARGRWTDDGGTSDHAADFRAKLKPRTGIPGRKKLLADVRWSILMARTGDVAGRAVGGKDPAWREQQISDLKDFASELEASIARLQAKPKPNLGASSVNSLASKFEQFLKPGGDPDARIEFGERLHTAIAGAKLSRAELHTLARKLDMGVPASMSGAKVRSKVLGRLRSVLELRYKHRSRDGRSAA